MRYHSQINPRLPSWPQAAFLTVILAAGLAVFSSQMASACNVPVFRFALERWHSDSYRVTLLHREPLTQDQQAILATLQEPNGKPSGNFVVRPVDVEQPLTEADKQLLESQQSAELPRFVVRYPEHLRIEIPVWSAPLDRESVARLTESPLRKELIRRLTEGQTAVWLMLESGSPESDDATAAVIEAELKKLEQFLSLPELTDTPADDLLTTVPLKVAFSLIRVPRNDPREEALLGMLLRAEPDLAERNDPMAFPVFGRGRALLPLVGPGITPKNIHDAAAFLVGPCSCEIKELNPGFDLLLSAPWDDLIYDGEVPPQVLVNEVATISPDPVLVPIPSGSRASGASPAESSTESRAVATAVPSVDTESLADSAGTATHAASTGSTGSKYVLLILAGMVFTAMLVIGYGYP